MPRPTLLLAILSSIVGLPLVAATPKVTRVEPPDWPASAKPEKLLVLLGGTDLAGVRVRCGSPGFQTGPAEVNATGTFALFELTLPANTPPAAYPCRVEAATGAAEFAVHVVPALSPAGRFQGFSNDDVIYLAMPDRFANGDPSNDDPAISRGLFNRSNRRFYHGGDLAGIRRKLPYLRHLGVTALWLTPVYDNGNQLDPRDSYNGEQMTSYHGYAATDLYRVEEHFGTLDEYRQLVDEAHQLGLKVIQDQVANHVGSLHPWLGSPPRPSWIHGTAAQHLAETWQTWLLLDPQSPPLRRGVLDGWFAPAMPDLNQDDPLLARYLIQNSLWWVARTGVDGIREDTVPYVPRPFWRQWTKALHDAFPQLKIVGEVLEPDPALPAFYQGGRPGFDGIDTGLDRVFDFPLYFAIRDVFVRHQPPLALARVLAHDSLYPDPQRLVTLLGLHDTSRFMGEPGATREGLANAFTFLFTARGLPLIYAGDEIGQAGGDDPENRRDFPGGWPGDPRDAFTPAGRTGEENQLFEHVRQLIRLRRGSHALRHGTMETVHASSDTYAYIRATASEQMLVVVHQGGQSLQLQMAELAGPGVSAQCLIGCARPAMAPADAALSIAPRSASVYRLTKAVPNDR